ncbi:AMP-binding protein [Thermodesulfobacteriota bacterium]
MLPTEISERWFRKFGVPIYNGYSATETCGGCAMAPMGVEAPPGSAGKITPLRKVRLVNPDTLEPVLPEEPGELLVSSDHMVRAYWNKPEETANCFIEMDGRLWYRTRDIFRIDKDGCFFYVDRTADIIKHKGYRVSAAEIEE